MTLFELFVFKKVASLLRNIKEIEERRRRRNIGIKSGASAGYQEDDTLGLFIFVGAEIWRSDFVIFAQVAPEQNCRLQRGYTDQRTSEWLLHGLWEQLTVTLRLLKTIILYKGNVWALWRFERMKNWQNLTKNRPDVSNLTKHLQTWHKKQHLFSSVFDGVPWAL